MSRTAQSGPQHVTNSSIWLARLLSTRTSSSLEQIDTIHCRLEQSNRITQTQTKIFLERNDGQTTNHSQPGLFDCCKSNDHSVYQYSARSNQTNTLSLSTWTLSIKSNGQTVNQHSFKPKPTIFLNQDSFNQINVQTVNQHSFKLNHHLDSFNQSFQMK